MKTITLPIVKTYTEIENEIRLKVRRVDENQATQEALQLAKETGKAQVHISHGGSVANSYRYPAETEGCVVIAFPTGSFLCRVERLPANKVSDSGVFAKITGYRGYADLRFSADAAFEAKMSAILAAEKILGI